MKSLEDVKKVVFEAKPVFARVYEKYGEKNWLTYIKNSLPRKQDLPQESLELIDYLVSFTSKLLGKKEGENLRQLLLHSFFADSSTHHGILNHPFFLNSTLARSHKDARSEESTLILSTESISLSNSSYPRGVFFHLSDLNEFRIPFVSLKYRRFPLYGMSALSKEELLKEFDEAIIKNEGIAREKLMELKDKILFFKGLSERLFEVKTLSEQYTILNQILWKEIFNKENVRGNLITLPLESLTRDLLLKIHLKKETSIYKIIFNQKWRELYQKHLEGVQGAHDTEAKKGTHLFWYLDHESNERKNLFVSYGALVSLDKKVQIPLKKEEVKKALEEKRIMPSMALCFSIISFYHGLTLGGGFSQVQYLGKMKDAYLATLNTLGKVPEALPRTDIFTGEFVLLTLRDKKNIVPGTLLDLFIYKNKDMLKLIDEVIEKVNIKDSLDAMMPEFYKIITGETVEINDMSIKKLPNTLKVKEPVKRCIHCGNNPTNHFTSFIMQSVTVPLTPLVSALSFLEQPFFTRIVKVVLTPYMWVFRSLRMLQMNKNIDKAFTKRSEVIWEEANKRGIIMEQFVIWGKAIEQYRAKINGKWRYFESIPIPPGTEAKSYNWMDDKAILKKKFFNAGVAVAYGASVTTWEKAEEIFKKATKPIIVKPQLGSRGRHTTTHIYNLKDLKKAYEIAKELCYFVVIEEHLIGSVYRATYVGGEIVGVLRGDPPRITGDGVKNIKELIEGKNQNKREGVKDVLINSSLIEFIGRQNYDLQTILPYDKTIDLSEKIGISYGGYSREELPETHPKLLQELKKAGDYLSAPVVGFDFIIPDATKEPEKQKWGIIEANSLPFINLHHFPLEGKPINVAGKVWDLWNIESRK